MNSRKIWPKLKKDLTHKEAIVITGPRQVGKTTTVKWLLSQIQSDNKIYFDLENVADRNFFQEKDYNNIISKLELRGIHLENRIYIAIDEIQLLKNIPSIVKYLIDHYQIKFILTGSSSYYLKNTFNESLAGRKFLYEMLPLTFGEFLEFNDIKDIKLPKFDVTSNFNRDLYDRLSVLYNEYIEFGSLPAVALAKSIDEKKQITENIFSSYINLDVQTLADFRDGGNIAKLITLLAKRIGNKLNISDIAEVLGISRPTINTYMNFLEQTYVIKRIKVFSKSPDVQSRKQEKIYFIDTGIASINADLSGGAKFENTIAHQLSLYGELTYYETRNGEIDFILDSDTALEVKETPLSKHQYLLNKKTQKCNSIQSRLIGRYKPAKFDDFLWGGLIS